ncbi:hypothetical protein I3842_11G138900 [Carya illinoinensis]|uniref:GPI transamidase subunit PIG-U n=1 Tax=Carya illinoinensis TaxID=32201 RepID=A0A922DQ61_CARIL|nr:hypothetical protein I3842_11G138900 [Carya illinoinensis]
MEPKEQSKEKKEKLWFWNWLIASVIFRLVLIYFPKNLNLASRPEVSTPLTSLRRLAEGYWLKQLSVSPYAGSMYHGSPLLLSLLGPLTVKRIEGQPDHLLCSLVFVIADIVNAMLIRATGQKSSDGIYSEFELLDHVKLLEKPEIIPSGDIAALVYLWNPFTIVACVGLSTSQLKILPSFCPFMEHVNDKLFGSLWMGYSNASILYPAILIIPMIFY